MRAVESNKKTFELLSNIEKGESETARYEEKLSLDTDDSSR